jgi:hypothetical protein
MFGDVEYLRDGARGMKLVFFCFVVRLHFFLFCSIRIVFLKLSRGVLQPRQSYAKARD